MNHCIKLELNFTNATERRFSTEYYKPFYQRAELAKQEDQLK